ncbi:hypothetical protein [Mycobacterium sp. MMS18-G62]
MTERLAAALEGMTLHSGAVNTVFTGEVKDQSQLYGLLDRLRDLGLELISVQPETAADRATDDDQTEGRVKLPTDGHTRTQPGADVYPSGERCSGDSIGGGRHTTEVNSQTEL